MKTHGPDSPQSVRGLLERRRLRGLLDTRRLGEADLRTAEYVGPFGKAFHTVKNSGGGVTYVVADQTGGRTFSTGAAVIVGSETGQPGEAILGGAPAGKKGGVPRTRIPRRRGSVPTPNQYAFGADGNGLMLAMLYSDANFLSTRGTTAELTGNACGCILTDSSELVGVGSLLFHGDTTLYVWDVEGTTVYSYAVPSGWKNPTNLYYQNGYLYWVEFEDIPVGGVGTGDSTFDYRLRRSNTDLTSVTTVTTATSPDVTDYGPSYAIYDSDPMPWAFAVDADGAVLYMGVATNSGAYEVPGEIGLQARFALSGGAPSVRDWSASELGGGTLADGVGLGGYHCATIGTTSFAIEALYAKTDDASGAASSLWPSVAVTRESFNVGTGGSVLQIYGSQTLLRGIASGTLVTNAVEAFDLTPTYPFAMYYFGE